MTDSPANPQLDALKAKLTKLAAEIDLSGLTSSAESLERSLTYHQQAIKRLGDANYSRTDALSAILNAVDSPWQALKTDFDRHLAANRSALEAVHARANALIEAAGQTNRQDVTAQAEVEVADLESRLKAAENGLSAQLKPLSDAASEIGNQLAVLEWGAKKWKDFPDAQSGESLLIASEAEWLLTGDDKQDPDGTLYMTDKRLIFERDEKTGKLLGMFGGKKQKETGLAVALSQIASVEAEDARKGMGTEDRIHLTITGDTDYPQTSFELKGRSSNEAWVEMLGKVRAGQSIFSAPHVDLPPLDDSMLPAAVQPLPLLDELSASAANFGNLLKDALSSASAKSAALGGGMAAAMGGMKKEAPAPSGKEALSGGMASAMGGMSKEDAEISSQPTMKLPSIGGMKKESPAPSGKEAASGGMGAALGSSGRPPMSKEEEEIASQPTMKLPSVRSMMRDALTEDEDEKEDNPKMGHAGSSPMGGKGQQSGGDKGAEGHTPMGQKPPNASSGGSKKDAD
jgi:hypothetical protein